MKKGLMLSAFLAGMMMYSGNALCEKSFGEIKSFVTQNGSQFYLDGKPFRFAGSNNYYMHYGSHEMIDSVLDDAVDMGITVLRVWGFMDGPHHGHAAQIKPFDYNVPKDVESAFEKLDYTVMGAKKRGIRLVIALTNNWDDFGGIPQYVKWFGGKHHDDFYTDKRIIDCYKSYVKHLISHENQYTHVVNSNEPAIMTWELGNEPRCQSDKSGETLYKWAEEMSLYVHSLAPKQLVALGSEGFFARAGDPDWTYNGNDGVDWDRIITIPSINYGTFHLYPKTWSKDNAEQWGTRWILEHAKAARKAQKPAVLEEYGIGRDEPQNREFIYRKWTKTAFDEGINGTMVWILTGKDPSKSDGLYPDYDGFRVLNGDGLLQKILKDHSKDMRNIAHEHESEVYIAAPKKHSKITEDKVTVKTYLFLNGDDTLKSIRVTDPALSFSIPMTDKDNDGYYEAELAVSSELSYGENKLKVITEFENGKSVESDVNFEILPEISSYESINTIIFDKTLSGVSEGGGYQAEFKNPALEYFYVNNTPMLKINADYKGTYDWEELRVHFTEVRDFSSAKKVRFTLYYPYTEALDAAVRPYAVAGDGWLKLGVDKNSIKLSSLPLVTLNNQKYFKHEIEIDMGDMSSKQGDFYICAVGNKYPLGEGILLDKVEFLKPVFKK